MYFQGQFIHYPAKPVSVVDTTGAGDAFVAGLLAGLADSGIPTNTRQLERIIAQAQICGALATTAKGAMTAQRNYQANTKVIEIGRAHV